MAVVYEFLSVAQLVSCKIKILFGAFLVPRAASIGASSIRVR